MVVGACRELLLLLCQSQQPTGLRTCRTGGGERPAEGRYPEANVRRSEEAQDNTSLPIMLASGVKPNLYCGWYSGRGRVRGTFACRIVYQNSSPAQERITSLVINC
jgi:hypothetical protein